MRDPRNPFRLRRSENIDSDTVFLNLFEPGILEIFPEDRWSETVQVIRSAPGGGKTSLLRLLTPEALHTLYAGRTKDTLKELYQRMVELGAFGEGGPRLLGVMMSCGRNYSTLQDLDLDQGRKNRLFFGLLNARIVLATLRAAMAIRQLDYPADLHRLRVTGTSAVPGLVLPCTGQELFGWAEQLEARVCDSLDSFGPLRTETLVGHESLLGLSLVRPDALTIDGRSVADRVLLMMDDIHQLTADQRSLLIGTVIESRSPVGVWIAERFEALSTEEILASGAVEGRDVEQPIELERYWRRRHAAYEKLAMRIADRRVRSAADTELDSFRACLRDELEGREWDDRFTRISDEVSTRVRERVGHVGRFQDWIAAREQLPGTPRERAVSWRALEILIERDLNKQQKGLYDEEECLDEEDLQQKDDASVNAAAELFLAREYDLPYYFGAERVSRLASLNTQQFLGLAGDIFEEVVASVLLRRPHAMSPERQHALMKKAAKAVWNEIPKRVRRGNELRKFLESVGKFAAWYTYRPSAPNDPGVGGTAIRMSERSLLTNPGHLGKRPDHRRFAELIASALAHNLLVADLDYNCKKERWMVLNFNRLLCVHFDLPLNYGLYKERPLQVLVQWMDRVFTPPANQESLL